MAVADPGFCSEKGLEPGLLSDVHLDDFRGGFEPKSPLPLDPPVVEKPYDRNVP